MLEKGYNGTSIEDICARAEVTKGAFFYHFKNKEALGKATVEFHLQLGANAMSQALFMKESDPLKKLIGFIDFTVEGFQHPVLDGCLLGALSEELAGRVDSIILQTCHKGLSAWIGGVEEMIEAAKKKYSPSSRVNCEDLAAVFVSAFEGAVTLARAGSNISVVKTTMGHYKKYLLQTIKSKT